jgi:ribonuclease BN (tRNA processing enzyme)
MKDLLGLGMDDPFFPVDIDDLPVKLEIDEMTDGSDERVGPFRVRSSTIFHPAPALAYRIEADGRSLVYATDTEDAFSGKPNPVIPLAAHANTLIHDGQFLRSDFKATWGHSTVDAAVDVAARAQVGRLVLYHHDPDRSDDALDQIARDAQRAASDRLPGLEVVVAREGLELTI